MRDYETDDLEVAMATDIQSVVNVAQLKYRHYYETCIRAYCSRDSFVVELLILVNAGPERIPEIHRLWRTDAIWREQGKERVVEFELDPPVEFAPIREVHPTGVLVTMHPLVWNACEFHFSEPAAALDAVGRWHAKWIDEADSRPQDQHGLAGVIHWLRQPIRNGNRVNLLVDFGSSPASAFHELIAAFADSGVSALTVGSFDYPAKRGDA